MKCVIKPATALELIWSTEQETRVVLGQVHLIKQNGCIVKGTSKDIRLWSLFIGTALIHQGLKKWCDLVA